MRNQGGRPLYLGRVVAGRRHATLLTLALALLLALLIGVDDGPADTDIADIDIFAGSSGAVGAAHCSAASLSPRDAGFLTFGLSVLARSSSRRAPPLQS